MTRKEKQLLLKDLCMRLPYRVFIRPEGLEGYELMSFEPDPDLDVITGVNYLQDDEPTFITDGSEYEIGDFKPYLRPMSSMTEEERLELSRLTDDKFKFYLYTTKPEIVCYEKYNYLEGLKVLDWFNEHHFDYRGLIEKGLAIEVTEDNNPYK